MARDTGVSDVLATVLLLGVTIAIVAVAALQVTGTSTTPPSLRLDTLLIAPSGSDHVTLLHAGGSSLLAGDLRVIVIVDSAVWYDGAAGLPGRLWAVGDTLEVGPFQALIPVDARVEVTVSHQAAGQLLAEISTVARAAIALPPPPAPGFTVSLSAEGGMDPIVIEPPAGLLVEAEVKHPQGRKFVRFVFADFTGFDGVDWEQLRDDGVQGDRLAGDGIYSAITLVPVNTTSGEATITVTAVDFQGRRVTDAATVTILTRQEVTEGTSNPTGTPAPGSAVCPLGNAAIARMEFEINGQFTVPSLTGRVRQGDHVKVLATVADGCVGIELSLASYTSSSASFTWQGAQDSHVFDARTVTANAGAVTMEVDVPPCFFTVDLVRGAVRSTFGPPSSNNYYSREGRLLDSDNGGVSTCVG